MNKEEFYRDNIEVLTPMLRQYFTLKNQVSDAILFFRMGDFYEIFGSDAEDIAPILEIALTSREKGSPDKNQKENRIPFCGVPHHSAKNYWLKLLKKGKKVAIADQIEDACQSKGLVKREITRILSPGVMDELEGLEGDLQNYILGVFQKPGAQSWVISLIDVSIGELRCGVLESFEDVINYIRLISPKEILTRKIFKEDIKRSLNLSVFGSDVILGDLSEGILRDDAIQGEIVKDLVNGEFGGEIDSHSLALLASMLHHLQTMKVNTSHFRCIRPLKDPETMKLDEAVIRDLEVFESSRRRETSGTLYRSLNSTLSPMGARLLRRSLLEPLLNRDKINERHKIVAQLASLGEESLSDLRSRLKGIPDLERLSLRVGNHVVQPNDLAKVRQALRQIKDLSLFLQSRGISVIVKDTPFLFKSDVVLELLENSLEEHPQSLGAGNGVFRTGYDEDLDKKRIFALEGEKLTLAYQDLLRDQTGISSLKIKPQKNFGLLIEVTRANRQRIPSEFIQKQTMVNSDRFSTIELQELSERLDSAQEQCIEREKELYYQLLADMRVYLDEIRNLANVVGFVDMVISFGWNAVRNRYVLPRWSHNQLMLKGSRHPVVEQFVGEHEFFANDIVLQGCAKQVLITGPNMGGKSTLMRQVALTALMAQIGCYVPANEAILPIFDGIFTRVGASDDLARGQSTFMVEMSEAAHILRKSTQKSLVILDEIGRGTSSQDGLALAASILQDIAERVGCYAFFATHYHELAEFSKKLESVKLMQTEVLERGESIVFTHRLKDGSTSSSYGIEVARLAGVPKHVVQLAKEIALEKNQIVEQENIAKKAEDSIENSVIKKSKLKTEELPLESAGMLTLQSNLKHDLLGRLQTISRLNLYRMTPLQAMNILAELQEEICQDKSFKKQFAQEMV